MGIQGLLPLLKSIQQPICISELAGSTMGVDVYCWLHKGAYGCAFELAQGNDSNVYINYVMRRVNMMLYYKVKPILVFDGGYLPSKSEKEAERRQRRSEYKSQGLEHLKSGNKTQASECFQKSIDITPEMALNVMKACRAKGVDCIVAPYEADAQLAYLMKAGITKCTISEDSDLLVYGCEKVIFKMDANGAGLMIDLNQLPKLEGLRMDGFTQQKFREMCILSGCDYLQSVKGMGLITAHKMLRKHSSVKKLIGTLRLNTKMSVPRDYEKRFEKAEQTFLYQIVFDPNTNKLLPLNPLPDDIDPKNLNFAGHCLKWKQEDALDLAVGNLNPLTGTRIGNFDLTKALSTDENGKNTSSEKEKSSSMKTSFCPQVKKPQSALSSKTRYEAEKNLNGVIRETKSSEKASSQFVTPVKSKRPRTKSADERQQDSSKLARLYLTTTDEMTVDVKFELTEPSSESAPQFQTSVQPQLKIKRNNPFRSPLVRKPQAQSEQVVSRYCGLAGMEVMMNEPSLTTDDGSKTTSEDSSNEAGEDTATEEKEQNSERSTSSHEEHPNFNEQEDADLQESGYLSSSQTTENSSPANPKVTTNSPPLHNHSPPLQSPPPSPPNFPPLPTFLTTPKSRNNTKRKLTKKKLITSQMSLDTFAFKKNRVTTEDSKTEASGTSPKRTVLAACSPPNYEMEKKYNEYQEDKMEGEDKKENYNGLLKHGQNEVENISHRIQEKSKINAKFCDTLAKTQPKLLGVRNKPTTGLGRCRAVGLSRPRENNKDTTNKTNNTLAPLFNYFSYQSRDRTSREHVITLQK